MRKKIPSLLAICLLLVTLLAVGWFLAVNCIVHLQAESAYYRLQDYSNSFFFAFSQDDPMWTSDSNLYTKLDTIANMFNRVSYLPVDERSSWLARQGFATGYYPMYTAVILEGTDWTLENGDYLYFSRYHTQQQWENQNAPEQNTLYVRLHREGNDPFAALYDHYDPYGFAVDAAVLRITGTIDGQELTPIQIDYVSKEQAFTDNTAQLRQMDAAGRLTWQTMMKTSATTEGPLQVLYVTHASMTVHQKHPITYRDQEYDSLLSLLQQVGQQNVISEQSLDRLLLFDRFQVTDQNGEPVNVRVVFCAYPLAATQVSISWILSSSSMWLAIIAALVILYLYRRLVLPVKQSVAFMQDDWNSLLLNQKPSGWKEHWQLQALLEAEENRRVRDADRIQRLDKALNYAHNAEKNRRQLTSNIAHELKTPLAIIHSYAEGLKEQIAEEKREQYLDTILAEVKQMDAMVMELLDLSRLEAGKVTLHREPMDLSALVQSCWEPFAPMAATKALQVQLDLAQNCRINADETRLRQVLRNFLSNAVRYTPAGGQVIIRVQIGKKRASFRVENTAEAFTPEALEKVWDSFYRVDKARSDRGTGLGLTIAKSIITLHGGSCHVRNTSIGVEFRFEL